MKSLFPHSKHTYLIFIGLSALISYTLVTLPLVYGMIVMWSMRGKTYEDVDIYEKSQN